MQTRLYKNESFLAWKTLRDLAPKGLLLPTGVPLIESAAERLSNKLLVSANAESKSLQHAVL